MSVLSQIALGTIILAICSAIHVTVLVATVGFLRQFGKRTKHWRRFTRAGTLLGVAFSAVILAHTIQVWIWALSLLAVVETLPDLESAVYFVLVTATTVGYGDLTLGPDFRILGAFAGVTGLLTFGLSTAILVGLFERLLSRNE